MCHVIENKEFVPFLRDEDNPGRLIGGKAFTITGGGDLVPLYQSGKRYSMMPTTEGLWIGAPANPQIVRFALPVDGERFPLRFYRLVQAGIHVSPVEREQLERYGVTTYGSAIQTWLPLVKFNSGEILFYDGYDVSVAKVLVPWEHVPPSLWPEEVWEMRCKERRVLELEEGMISDEALELLFQTDWDSTLVQAYVQTAYESRVLYEIQIHKAVKSISFNQILKEL